MPETFSSPLPLRFGCINNKVWFPLFRSIVLWASFTKRKVRISKITSPWRYCSPKNVINYSRRMRMLSLHVNNACVGCCWHRTHALCLVYIQRRACAYVMILTQTILSKMAPGWHRGEELLNKGVIFCYLCAQNSNFLKLRLSHWCHMDNLNDVLTTFLGLDRVSCVTIYGGSESSRIS